MLPNNWRRLWRGRGLAVDKLLPVSFGVPSPVLQDLETRAPRAVLVPGGSRQILDDTDRACVVEGVLFAAAYVAECLPVQVVDTDLRGQLPAEATHLAVRKVGEGEIEYMGSFDLLLRVHARRAGVWQPFNKTEMALDFKMTGAASPFGLNGATMRTYIENARAVMLAALDKCTIIAFLIYRPPGPTYDGRAHRGGEAFVAFNADTLCTWSPSSQRPPSPIVMTGSMLQEGKLEPMEPTSLPKPIVRAPRRDLWGELSRLSVKRGWVQVKDFVTTFELPPRGTPKKATQKALNKLRDAGYPLEDSTTGRSGRPKKIARIAHLSNVYPDL